MDTGSALARHTGQEESEAIRHVAQMLQYVLLVLLKSICLFLGLDKFLRLETCRIFSHYDIWLLK